MNGYKFGVCTRSTVPRSGYTTTNKQKRCLLQKWFITKIMDPSPAKARKHVGCTRNLNLNNIIYLLYKMFDPHTAHLRFFPLAKGAVVSLSL